MSKKNACYGAKLAIPLTLPRPTRRGECDARVRACRVGGGDDGAPGPSAPAREGEHRAPVDPSPPSPPPPPPPRATSLPARWGSRGIAAPAVGEVQGLSIKPESGLLATTVAWLAPLSRILRVIIAVRADPGPEEATDPLEGTTTAPRGLILSKRLHGIASVCL